LPTKGNTREGSIPSRDIKKTKYEYLGFDSYRFLSVSSFRLYSLFGAAPYEL